MKADTKIARGRARLACFCGIAGLTALVAVALPTMSTAQTNSQTAIFVPFPAFVKALGVAQADRYVGQAGARVQSASEFGAMRAYLLGLYQGVTVSHSYLLDDQTFDCIPVMQQPSVRALGISKLAEPPPSPAGRAPADDAGREPAPSYDAFGNVQECADGTVPMRRITLDELVRYPSLREFFRKSPGSVTEIEGGAPRTVTITHRWAHAYDFVNNYGGQALHNVWLPKVNTGTTEVFSLSQQWYSGGSGNALQTAEIGWQNYPQKWGGQKPVIFVYWTADDYNSTGCYNLECTGFVQTSSKDPLGARLKPVSTAGGGQYEEYFGYYLYNGAWWAAIGGSAASAEWVGYIPVSVYRGGQMSKHATEFDIGGETAGGTHWAPMGSGQWADAGYQQAAYDRAIQYRDSANNGHAPTLTPTTQGSNAYKCYSYTTPAYTTSNGWLTYFYLGGPGGKKC